MAFKFVVFSCVLALARAGVAPVAVAARYAAAPLVAAAPFVAAAPVAARLEEFDPVPQYRFGYDVADSLTGDYKSQQEERNGDFVKGQYSLVESDGTRRIVDYAADPVNGFNAIVRNEPLVAAAPAVVAEPAVIPARIATAPVAVAEPVIAARAPAPVVARYTAGYTAPVVPARYAYASAPVTRVAAVSSPVARLTASPYAFNYASASAIVV